MIAWLSGAVLAKKPPTVIIDTGGVGYLVSVSMPTYYTLPEPGQKIALHIYTQVREDAIALYGFPNQTELEIFKKLIGVTKVGPKLAMSVLSGLPSRELVTAVRGRDSARLSATPGVGTKTADRIILELADKLEGLLGADDEEAQAGAPSSVENDAVEALVSLGYKPLDARKTVKSVLAANPKGSLEELIKISLGRIA